MTIGRWNTGLTAEYDRPIMGRKGIGKLSLFSIADTVEVQSVKGEAKNGFVMSAAEIEEQNSREEETPYYPNPLPDDKIMLAENGTRIVLTKLKIRVTKAAWNALKKRVARRFSIIGTEDFTVRINGKPVTITDRDYFHKLQYLWCYGEDSEKYVGWCKPKKPENIEKRNETIEIGSGENIEAFSDKVTGWIGTVRKARDVNDPDDNLNKIVIMVRGKLAQEDMLKEFTDGGLYTKYIIGELHADFLDSDDQDDIATSSRQEIIKDDPRYIALRNWVKKEMRYIESRWGDLRNEGGEKEARQIPAINKWLDGLGKDKQKQAKAMFGKIGKLTLEDDERIELYKHSVLAFETLRYKNALSILDKVSPENIHKFTEVFAELDDIEASLYYQIVQERLEVIHTLRKQVKNDVVERVIQEHLYKHLWLLDPSWDRATETPLMEQNVRIAFGVIDAGLSDDEKNGRFDIKYKMTSGKHVIIELKRAGRKLSHFELLEQVDKYGEALRKLVQAIGKNEPVEIVCIVGKPLAQWENPEQQERSKQMLTAQNIRVVLYQELIENAYRSYRAFLDKHEEAGSVYELIRNIEINSPR